MSRAILEKLLKEEIENIKRSSEIYRFQSDQEAHQFTVTTSNINKEITAELEKRGVKITDGIKNIINQASVSIINSILEYFKNKKFLGQLPEISATDSSISIVVYSPVDELIWKPVRTRINPNNWVKVKATIFDTISQSYKNERAKLVKALNKQIEEDGSNYKIKGQFLAVGHSSDSAIVSKRISSSRREVFKRVGLYSRESTEKLTPRDIKELFGDDIFSIIKKDNSKTTLVQASIESATLNSEKGRTVEKQLKQEYLNSLEKAIKYLNTEENFANRPGSDSRTTLEKKKIVKSFVDGVVKNKKVKTSSINTKPNYSNAKVSKKVSKKKPKIVRVKEKVKTPSINITGIAKPSKPTINLGALKAQINARLSMQVIKNMGTPALENRTGRFARSAIVTDVVQTRQGFPSIGYTYQKYPYQTFEPGFKQGSTQRDPRALIDRSIREIATQLIVGRFYTRRV